MGRVSLDQLEALKEKMSNLSSGEEEEMVEGQEEEGPKEQEDKEGVVVDNKMEIQEEVPEESERLEAKGTGLVLLLLYLVSRSTVLVCDAFEPDFKKL